MERNTNKIYDDLIAEKANNPLLNTPNSNSATAIWRMWLYIVAYVTSFHEALWTLKKKELQQMASITLVGTEAWYIQKILEFQNDDELVKVNGVWQYSVIDEAKKIVKRVSLSKIERGIFIKVAGEDEDGNAIQIAGEQLSNLAAYINFIKISGTEIELVSLAPDKLQFNIDVYFTGTYTIVRDAVIASILNYISSLSFNGAITRGNLITQVKNVEGTVDVYINSMLSKFGDNTAINIVRSKIPESGYWILDGLDNSFPEVTENSDGSLTINNDGNCTINFIPNN